MRVQLDLHDVRGAPQLADKPVGMHTSCRTCSPCQPLQRLACLWRDLAHLLTQSAYRRGQPQRQRQLPDHYLQVPEALVHLTSATSGLITQHFATPLSASLLATTLYSTDPQHRLFGAQVSPYSTWWTGASFALPPCDARSIHRALRWAVTSALRSTEPCCTYMLVPLRKTASYHSLHYHPLVCVLNAIPGGQPGAILSMPLLLPGCARSLLTQTCPLDASFHSCSGHGRPAPPLS